MRHLSVVSIVILAAAVVTALAAGAYLVRLRQQVAALAQTHWRSQAGGVLILCGGSTAPEVRDCFLECAGGRQARLVLIPAYYPSPEDRARLVAPWHDRGITSVTVLDAQTREEASAASMAEVLASATGAWIGGGDQAYLADVYVDTEVDRQLKALLARGGVVCGSSAGAAAITRAMIRGNGVQAGQKGFDLLPGAVVDQHFFHRNRTQRLLAALADNPNLVGVGIDEGTAVVIEKHGKWSVIGRSYVMVCLPTESGFPRIEVLKSGDSTNINLLKTSSGITAISSPTLLDETLGPDATH